VILEAWANGANRTEKRLDEMRDPNLRRRKEETQGGNAMTRVLEAATPALAKPLQPKNEKEASALKQRLCEAGFRSEKASTVFLGLKVCGLGLGAVAAGVFTLFQGRVDFAALMKVVASAGICFFLPELLLTLLRSRRKESIFLGLPDALDLMVVCVEAGLGLDQAMRKVSEEMKKSFPTIADEFGLCNLQLQMGRTRNHVLQELGARSGVDDLRSLASILIQADKFGSSIAQALRVQSDAMRTRRKQIAEEKAAKTAVKLIFPLVIFIFPGIFVVLVGPAAVTMVKEMFPIMGS
jgi:tight adherence protein C